MKTTRFILFLLLCMVCASSVNAQESTDALADRIQEKYNTLQSFKADFTQELTNITTGAKDVRTGTIWFTQPSLVRWVTNEPEKEVLVLGPDFAWDYFEEENIVFKYQVSQLLDSKTILRFLSGQANIKADFSIRTEWEGAEAVQQKWGEQYTVLQLTPKEPEPGMVQAYIGVEPKSGLLHQIMIVDFYGNGNEIVLSNIQEDLRFDPKLFAFQPDKDTQVEDNTGAL